MAFIVLCIEMKTFHRRLVVKNVLKFLVIRVACLARKFLLSQLSKTDTVATEPNSSYYLKRERERGKVRGKMSVEKEKKGANLASFLGETLNYILKTIELC